jgi:DNA-binding NarL/FixJ family response regulator
VRVLIVDDHEVVRRGIRELLLSLPDLEICGEATDGVDAVAKAQALRPDAITMDISMPRMNGLEATRQIRPLLPDTTIVVLSQYDVPEMMKQAMNAGASAYVVKTAVSTNLIAAVKGRRAGKTAHHPAGSTTEVDTFGDAFLDGLASPNGELQPMLDAAIRLLSSDFGNVQAVTNGGVALRIVAQRGFGRSFLDIFREVSTTDDCACGRALRAGERVIVEDTETDVRYAPFREIAREAGYRSVQSTPLIGGDGKILGMLSTHWRSVHRPSESSLCRLDTYTRQVSEFIERCRSACVDRVSNTA